LLRVASRLNELMENPADDCDLFFGTQRESHSLVLNAFLLVVFQHMDWFASLVEQQTCVTEGRPTADPVALFCNSDASVRNLDAEFFAELRGPESLKLNVHGIKWIIRSGHSQRRVDYLLAVLFAFSAVSR